MLNSYWVNQDGVYKYYEVILVDPQHKAIRKDPRINWIVKAVHKVCFSLSPPERREEKRSGCGYKQATSNKAAVGTAASFCSTCGPSPPFVLSPSFSHIQAPTTTATTTATQSVPLPSVVVVVVFAR